MQCKNINELKLNFPLNINGQTRILKYGEVIEVPDGSIDMKGIQGWIICRPTPLPPSKLIEIDLTSFFNPFKLELTDEQKSKSESVIEESIKETQRIAAENRKRKEESKLAESISNQNNKESPSPISESNKEPQEVNSMEDMFTQKPVQPLKGKHIPKHVANRGIKSRIDKKKILLPLKDSSCVEVSEKK